MAQRGVKREHEDSLDDEGPDLKRRRTTGLGQLMFRSKSESKGMKLEFDDLDELGSATQPFVAPVPGAPARPQRPPSASNDTPPLTQPDPVVRRKLSFDNIDLSRRESPLPEVPETPGEIKDRLATGLAAMERKPWRCMACGKQIQRLKEISSPSKDGKRPAHSEDEEDEDVSDVISRHLSDQKQCPARWQYRQDVLDAGLKHLWCDACFHLSIELHILDDPDTIYPSLDNLFGNCRCAGLKNCLAQLAEAGNKKGDQEFWCRECGTFSKTLVTIKMLENTDPNKPIFPRPTAKPCHESCSNSKRCAALIKAKRIERPDCFCPIHNAFDRQLMERWDLGCPVWLENTRCGCSALFSLGWCACCCHYSKQMFCKLSGVTVGFDGTLQSDSILPHELLQQHHAFIKNCLHA